MKLKLYSKIYFVALFVASVTTVKAQVDPTCTIPGAYLCDNMDTYTSGDALGPGASWWTTWSGTEGGSEDGTISSDYAYSGANSVLIPEGGTTDALLLLGNQTTGTWKLEWQMYIPSGQTAYYNVQEDESSGVAWNLELYFGDVTEGTGEFTIPGTGVTFTYPVDEWFTVRHIFNLDADQIDVFIDGVNVLADTYTGNIGSINFYSAGTLNKYYLDDVIYMEITGEPCVLGTADICDNIETYTAGETIGSFADWWTTWSGTEGGAEDGIVSADQAYSGVHSMLIPEGGVNDVILLLGNVATGTYTLAWQMYVPDGKTAYYNIQDDETPGIAWNLDTYFGYSDVGVVGTSGEGIVWSSLFSELETFTYPLGQWFEVKHVINLDDELIDVWIDGVLVYSSDYAGTQIGSVDFYSIDANNRCYIDDVLYEGESTPVLTTYYEDADEDTYGNADVSVTVEGGAPTGYVENDDDCDDTNDAIYPGATEVLNNLDDDCDELIDEGLVAIQDVNASTDVIQIYPVPNDGNFTVNLLNSATENMVLEIYSVAGSRLFEQTLAAGTTVHEISLQNFAAGVYMLKVKQGQDLFVKQFVIE